MISTENKLKIVNYLQNGKKIEAIKFVRETQQTDLKEAAELVRSVELEFFPERIGLTTKEFGGIDTGLIVGSVFSALGAIFLIVVSVLVLRDQKVAKDSLVIQGTVTSLDYGSDGTAAPVIRYQLYGEKKIIHGTVWSSPPSYEIGEKVELLVNNLNPADVTINAFFERYFLIGIFGLFAVVFGGIGALVLHFLRN